MTVEQLETRKADLAERLKKVREQRSQIKTLCRQLEGAILVIEEMLTAERANGNEHPDI